MPLAKSERARFPGMTKLRTLNLTALGRACASGGISMIRIVKKYIRSCLSYLFEIKEYRSIGTIFQTVGIIFITDKVGRNTILFYKLKFFLCPIQYFRI
jgi:hypothetical protein